MTGPEKQRLITFLNAQRDGVLAVLDGLSPEHLRMSVVPSGWTPLGVVEHLGHAEWHWFQEVVRGETRPPPWTVHPKDARLTSRMGPAEAVAFYRDRIADSDRVIDETPLSAVPRGRHEAEVDEPVPDLRTVLLHMIEETARHLGHLDIARELLDGRTAIAQRF